MNALLLIGFLILFIAFLMGAELLFAPKADKDNIRRRIHSDAMRGIKSTWITEGNRHG